MAIQVKLRRGTATEHSSFAGAEGEVTVDTTNNTLHVHTGGGAGSGVRLAKLSEVSGGTGTVTLVGSGTGLTGGPITTSGTLSVADNGVTFVKMQDINTAKVIGRTTAGSGDPEEVSILDDDTMATASATSLATSESIKAYVDAQTGGISKWSSGWVTQDNQGTPTSVGNQATLTFTHNLGTADVSVCIYVAGSSAGAGANQVFFSESSSDRFGAVAKNMQSNSLDIQLAISGVHIVNSIGSSTTPSWGTTNATHIKVVVTG
jgi:hypothetical protein